MSHRSHVFHLAVPCKNLDEAVDYYEKLGCRLARRYPDRATFEFFGDQLVCHLAPEEIDKAPKMYPRHFGISFKEKNSFEQMLAKAKEAKLEFFQPLFVRFQGKPEEHRTFFLKDPSNNLLEFKYYANSEMIY